MLSPRRRRSPRLPGYASNQGVTLWLVVLILGFALAASLGASALVLGEVGQTRIISDSVVAFFAADAGVEQALYQLCQQNNKSDQN
ncbi:hypothetical protein HYW68_01955, partial [Candidatus Parcubacteria bacterium]|nr:hypothetical protein [Candidatus Parcubacteria bacterium]